MSTRSYEKSFLVFISLKRIEKILSWCNKSFLFHLKVITNPEAAPGELNITKNYNYDFSFWSHTDVKIILIM